MQTIAKEMYGAGEVELSQTVTEKIQLFNAQVSLFTIDGISNICESVSKTDNQPNNSLFS